MQITTEIYLNIAKKYKTTIYIVERCIRNAIEMVHSKADIDILYNLFDNMIPLDKGKMTNYEFIRTIADYVKFELYQFPYRSVHNVQT